MRAATLSKETLSGALFVTLGGATLFFAQQYEIGTALRMGPGFFPVTIAILLIVFGLGSIVQAAVGKTSSRLKIEGMVPLLLLCAGILSFALLLERAGLLIAIAALIIFACFQRLRAHPIETVVLYLVLTGFSAFVFVWMFGIPLHLLPLH